MLFAQWSGHAPQSTELWQWTPSTPRWPSVLLVAGERAPAREHEALHHGISILSPYAPAPLVGITRTFARGYNQYATAPATTAVAPAAIEIGR
ncbi:hypothetical protein BH11MYX1_BH11MYX1_35250 [soil metagenome]